MTDITRLSLTDAKAMLDAGRITSQALVSVAMMRVVERASKSKAWVHVDPGVALEQAFEADSARANGAVLGPLHGLPIGIKDIIDTADFPTENGTVLDQGRRPAADAFIVHRLRAAGAIIFGKTATTELAFLSPAPTHNPAAPGHTPGGSSAGSAAAVADCHVAAALGTQTAGSILRPASYCGVVGYKPSFGRISRTGVLTQSPPLDTIGTLTRTVEDAALLAGVLMAHDPADPDMRLEAAQPLMASATPVGAGRPRLAFVEGPAWGLVEPAAREAYRQWVAGQGLETVDLPAGSNAWLAAQRTIQFKDIARHYGHRDPAAISAQLAEVIVEGQAIPDAAYDSARALRHAQIEAMQALFAAYDVLLTPAALGPAPYGLESTGSPAANAAWTWLGVPAISLPLLTVAGRPLGVQLVAAHGDDARLLRAAQWLMQAGK